MCSAICTKLEEKFALNFELSSDGLYHKNIGLAVSGGVDSVAMLLLMHRFALKKNISLTVFTVNHNLRAEAASEVEFVARFCEKLQVRHIALSWDHRNNLSNISERARAGRYDLMTSCCHKLDILTVLTAHHFDDSIETYLLKDERKSGIMALSSSNIHFHDNIRILRPLFNIYKSELIGYANELGESWVEDSSNSTNKYLRNIIRKKIASEDLGYKDRLESELKRIDLEAERLNIELIDALATAAKIYEYGFASLDIGRLLSFEYEISLRLLSFVLNIVSGNIKTCRASTIGPLISALKQDEAITRTMHDCVVKRIKTNLLVYREFGKKLPKNVVVEGKTMWDSRFCLDVKGDDAGAYIANLNLKDYREIKDKLDLTALKKLSFNHHKAILFTLPVIKVLEKIVAIPHISYYEDCGLEKNIDYLYLPKFTSRFIHFY